jgi:hypothetical protein
MRPVQDVVRRRSIAARIDPTAAPAGELKINLTGTKNACFLS